jgi:hypothetical protein
LGKTWPRAAASTPDATSAATAHRTPARIGPGILHRYHRRRAAALALASLALVQSIAAGGIGVLGYVSARMTGRQLGGRRLTGVTLAIVGLLALAVSLAKGSGEGGNGSTTLILVWLGATAALALLALAIGRRTATLAVAQGIAGGLFFSIGDFSTKLATQESAREAACDQDRLRAETIDQRTRRGRCNRRRAQGRRQHQPRSRRREAASLVQVDDLERDDQSIAEIVDRGSSLKKDDGPRQARPPTGERTDKQPAHLQSPA